MNSEVIRIGTRKSKLALLQVAEVERAIGRLAPGVRVEVISIVSSGDRITDRPLADVGGKGLFTKELEEALLEGRIDIAVHSLKDMEWHLPAGLVLTAVLEREDVRDVLVSPAFKTLSGMPAGSIIGTASVRRAAQIRHTRPDLGTTLLRGNVPTRIEKIDKGECAGGILALAGLKRLGLTEHATEAFAVEQMLPAVAQGAIGIECRKDATEIRELMQRITHTPSERAVTAERAMLAILDGSCRTPIGGYAEIVDDVLSLRGEVLSLDGTERYTAAASGPVDGAVLIGEEVGKMLRVQAAHLLPGNIA